MFNFKNIKQLIEKELKPDEKLEHYIEGKTPLIPLQALS